MDAPDSNVFFLKCNYIRFLSDNWSAWTLKIENDERTCGASLKFFRHEINKNSESFGQSQITATENVESSNLNEVPMSSEITSDILECNTIRRMRNLAEPDASLPSSPKMSALKESKLSPISEAAPQKQSLLSEETNAGRELSSVNTQNRILTMQTRGNTSRSQRANKKSFRSASSTRQYTASLPMPQRIVSMSMAHQQPVPRQFGFVIRVDKFRSVDLLRFSDSTQSAASVSMVIVLTPKGLIGGKRNQFRLLTDQVSQAQTLFTQLTGLIRNQSAIRPFIHREWWRKLALMFK